MDENDKDWPRTPALKYKIPIGTLACPYCGVVASGAIEPICQWCERSYWEPNKIKIDKAFSILSGIIKGLLIGFLAIGISYLFWLTIQG